MIAGSSERPLAATNNPKTAPRDNTRALAEDPFRETAYHLLLKVARDGGWNQSMKLSGEEAQTAINLAWELYESPRQPGDGMSDFQSMQSRNRIKEFAIGLARRHDAIPSAWILKKGVVRSDTVDSSGNTSTDIVDGKLGNTRVSLKRLSADSGISHSWNQIRFQRLELECLLWKSLQHPNVVSLFGISQDVSNDHGSYMVFPRMPNGRIRQYISHLRSEGKLPSSQFSQYAVAWLHQVSLGLLYLHEEGVVHGDLHSGNILVDGDSNACIAHYGLTLASESMPSGDVSPPHTPRWPAPELASGSESSSLTPASDVYSFAFLCVELYTTNTPFVHHAGHQVPFRARDGEHPPRPSGLLSDELWNLITSCWDSNPHQRPHSKEVAERLGKLAARHVAEGTSSGITVESRVPQAVLAEDLESVAGFTINASLACKSFSNVGAQFDSVAHGVEGWKDTTPGSKVGTILECREEWRRFRASFVGTLTESQETATSAQACLLEFVEAVFPVLQDRNGSFDRKKASLEDIVRRLTTFEETYYTMSKGLKALCEEMESATTNWRADLSRPEGLLQKHLPTGVTRQLERLSDDLESLFGDPLTAVKVEHLKTLIFPVVAHTPRGKLLFTRALSTFPQKLGGIRNVWAELRAELEQIRYKLEWLARDVVAADSEETGARVLQGHYYARLEMVSSQASLLAQILREYCNAVIKCREDNACNTVG